MRSTGCVLSSCDSSRSSPQQGSLSELLPELLQHFTTWHLFSPIPGPSLIQHRLNILPPFQENKTLSPGVSTHSHQTVTRKTCQHPRLVASMGAWQRCPLRDSILRLLLLRVTHHSFFFFLVLHCINSYWFIQTHYKWHPQRVYDTAQSYIPRFIIFRGKPQTIALSTATDNLKNESLEGALSPAPRIFNMPFYSPFEVSEC